MKARLKGEVFSGAFGLGLLIMFCPFGFGSQDWDCSLNVHFLDEGVGNVVTNFPHIVCPLLAVCFFSSTKPKNGYWLD